MSVIKCSNCGGQYMDYKSECPHCATENILIDVGYSGRHKEGIMSDIEKTLSGHEYDYSNDPTSLTKFLKSMLWILLGISMLSLVSDFMQMNLLSSGTFSQAAAEANDNRQQIIGILYLVAFIVTGFLFLKWIHRANSNCHGFCAQGMEFTPGWAIGYYFIPIISFYKPYHAMKEIWKVSTNPANWQNENSSNLLGWWWALLLIYGFLGQASFRMSMQADTTSLLQSSTTVSIIFGIIDIPLYLVTISLISSIFTKQETLVKKNVMNEINRRKESPNGDLEKIIDEGFLTDTSEQQMTNTSASTSGDESQKIIEYLSDVATKQCPKCAEVIKLEAIVCRYCSHEFGEAEVAEKIADHKARIKEKEDYLQAQVSLEKKNIKLISELKKKETSIKSKRYWARVKFMFGSVLLTFGLLLIVSLFLSIKTFIHTAYILPLIFLIGPGVIFLTARKQTIIEISDLDSEIKAITAYSFRGYS